MLEFREIPGFPGYSVSPDGDVLGKSGKILKGRQHRSGHLYVSPMVDGRSKELAIHRAVLLSWVGPCPQGMEGCHADGDPLNNQLDNLRWDTSRANHLDAVSHGTSSVLSINNSGEASYQTSLTNDDVRKIRSMLASGSRQVDVARSFDVSRCVVSLIHRRKTWRSVE